MELKNRTILITGGASGIGLSLAKQLIAKHNQVIVCGRNQARLDSAKQNLPALETVRCDINNTDDLSELVSLLAAKFPQLDTLINNAGIQQKIDITKDEMVNQTIETEISTNLTAHIQITQRLYTLLSSNKNPAIIFMGSALGLVPKYEVPVYSAAKAGLHSFAQSIRHQAAQDNIQVIEVFPDMVETPMTQSRIQEKKMNPDVFASLVLRHLSTTKQEIFIGLTKVLNWLHRIAPKLALKTVN